MSCQIVNRLFDGIVLDDQSISVITLRRKELVDDVLGPLNMVSPWMQIVLGVQVLFDAMIAQVEQVSLATGRCRTILVGRSHVSRVFSDDIDNGTLILQELESALRAGPIREVWMRPSVGRHLMPI